MLDSRRHLVLPAMLAALMLAVAGAVTGSRIAAGDEPAGAPAARPGHGPPAPNPAPDSTLGWAGGVVGSQACGSARGAPPRVAHVVVIVLENHSYGQLIGGPSSAARHQAPYLNFIAHRCGLATEYHSLTHPSLPNYLAMTGGSTYGLRHDVNRQVTGPSIFSALDRVRGNWAVYAEDLPGPCWPHRTSALGYTPHHNPILTYANLTADCQAHDLPLGSTTSGPLADALRAQTLPSYSFIVPSLGHDMHTGSVRAADRWLSQWVTAILHSATYRNQSTVIFVTVDEGTGGHIGKGEICAAHPFDESCHVPLVVISRYVRPGTRVSTFVDHYSLLRTAADLLGIRAPGAGAHALSLRTAFGL